MRVISGKAKGIKLETIEGKNTRPTTDRIKESMFNLIQFEIPDKKVLDLFSGSGALGIEAASRGASHVTLVEQNRQCHRIIEANIKKCGLENIEVVKSEVLSCFMRLGKYDVIIMDPPYKKDFIAPVLTNIETYKTLSEDGLILVEHSVDDPLPETFGKLVQTRQKKYGKTLISIYRYDD